MNSRFRPVNSTMFDGNLLVQYCFLNLYRLCRTGLKMFLAMDISEILAKCKLKVPELALPGQEFFNFYDFFLLIWCRAVDARK